MGNTICSPQVWNWLRDYTEQISEDVGFKWGCCTKRLQQQETFSVSFYPATRGGFSPSPHPERWVPWTAFPWQWWIAAFIRSHSVQKSMHALKNVAPLCRHIVFPRTVFITAALTAKGTNTRCALYCKFAWAIKCKLSGNLNANFSHTEIGKARRAFSQTMV